MGTTLNCWELVVTYYLISLVAVQTIIEPPSPVNLTISWKNEFCLELSWRLPENVDENWKNCKYLISDDRLSDTRYETCVSLEGGVNFSVQTQCNGMQSQPVVHTIAAPRELVKDFHCFYYSSNALNCSWLPTNQSPEDIHLYYAYSETEINVSNTSECRSYRRNVGGKTGCLVRVDFRTLKVYFQVNGTVNGSSLRNTFKVIPKDNVKPPAPKVKITKKENNLNLSWNHPNISKSHCWNYKLNYSRCQESLNKTTKSNSETIPYDPRCQYRVQIKAVYSSNCGEGESDWSGVEIYATLFLFVILFLCCFMKHKEKIFPKIPQPSMTYKDTLNSSKEPKTFKGNLYVPVEENVEYKISLEKEPQLPTMQPDC
uniref:Type I cytokine receptor cytokine-binding domain-containing protein n=1 Tax=Esox lucius TaxID=8010 RepID=A0AAY5KXW6_ESOLU